MIHKASCVIALAGAAALIFTTVQAAPAPTGSAQLVGKRRHQALMIHKAAHSASPKMKGMAAGKRQYQPLVVHKPTDSASPK